MAFEYQTYRSPYAGTLADLIGGPSRARAQAIREAGAAQANARQISGQASAQMAQGIGNAFGQLAQIPQQIQQQKQQDQRAAITALQMQELRDTQSRLKALDVALAQGGRAAAVDYLKQAGQGAQIPEVEKLYDEADRRAEDIKRMRAETRTREADYLGDLGIKIRAFGYDPGFALGAAHHARALYEDDPKVQQQIDAMRLQIIENPESVRQIADSAIMSSSYRDALAPEKLTERDPTKDLMRGEVVVRPGVPKPEEVKRYPITVPGPNGQPIQKLVTAEELAGGIPAYREPKAPKEDSRFWVMRDGNPVRIAEAEYRVGDKPASTREQGRPVTDGSTTDLSDFDTALDDLAVLGDTIAPVDPKTGKRVVGVTGTSAKIGAKLPNWVTDLTTVGTDAKKKQALIDRVKQVIGKTLEGGVLRKEDELKYEKILPTIADTSEVVVSKLQGLQSAIEKRKQRRVDALEDAGYDVSSFRQRDAAKPPAARVLSVDQVKRMAEISGSTYEEAKKHAESKGFIVR